MTAGTKISAPNPPSKTGYTFGGWYKEAAGTNAWDFTTDLVNTSTVLYAKWVINSYTVSFDVQGGSAVPSVQANYNSTVEQPSDPVKIGHNFDGWYQSIDFYYIWDFSNIRITDNTTIYAKWVPINYAVSFVSNGGSSVTPEVAEYNTLISLPVNPSRSGYYFAGWYKDAGLTLVWDFNNDLVTSDVTLYAKWDEVPVNYTVTFISNGGSAVNSLNVPTGSVIVKPADPIKAGMFFDGWYKDSGLSNPWDFNSDEVISNVTLYAKWSEIIVNYTVAFFTSGGSAVSSINVPSGSVIAKPADPTKEGMIFEGWYKDVELTIPWDFSSDMVISNVTIFAKWDMVNTLLTSNEADFIIFPNPVLDELNIIPDKRITGQMHIKIYDLSGILVYEEISKEVKPVHFPSLPNGYYSLIISYNNQIITKKFIKQ